ncbi:fimbrillin family protein [Bacteroides sp.]|uniref:fimbrillin family protein n=1 Tax=Bacteroides sp. TaxID=29523 RepID=UPI00260573CF|nr:fimbrillin family protein [Bacteroides sp.]MDD3038682.1 fimbrillin family protein [Bacteroides sp.]
MKPHTKIFSPAIGFVLLLLYSCTDNITDSNLSSTDTAIRFTASVDGGQEAKTRVADNTSLASTFETGDEIGIYVVNYDRLSENLFTPGTLKLYGNHSDNMKHTFSVNGGTSLWTPEKPEVMQWADTKTPIDVFAYSPYSAVINDNAEVMTAVPFEVLTDQSGNNSKTGSAKRSNYQLSDLMYAKCQNQKKTNSVGKSSDPIDLKFSHLLSKMTIEVTLNEEFLPKPADKPYKVEIIGTVASSNIDFTKGEATVVPNATDFDPITPTNEQINVGVTYHYLHKAIFIPQTVKGGTNLLLFTCGTGKETKYFRYPVETDTKFEPNTHYLYRIVLGRYGITVKTDIIGWNDGGTTTGTPEKLTSFCNIILQKENLTESTKSVWNWKEASVDKLTMGYHLPTSAEIAEIWPTSTEIGFDKEAVSSDGMYFCDAAHKVIYGIKTDAGGKTYWMRWEYQGTGTDAKLKLSYWKSGGPENFNIVINNAGGSGITQAEKYEAIRNSYPVTRPEIIYLPSTEKDTKAGQGIYWMKDGDEAKTFSFDAKGVTQPVAITPMDETYAVRYIQNR